jgi:hypothetical protein
MGRKFKRVNEHTRRNGTSVDTYVRSNPKPEPSVSKLLSKKIKKFIG